MYYIGLYIIFIYVSVGACVCVRNRVCFYTYKLYLNI